MKKLIFALLGTLVLVSCKPVVGGNDEEEVIEETTITTPAGTPEGTPELPPYNPWVQVVADEGAIIGNKCSGTALFFIDKSVQNPLADLVADEKIKLEFVKDKTLSDSQRWFGDKDNQIQVISIYKVSVNKDKVDSLVLEDESLKYYVPSTEQSVTFSFEIAKENDCWKMKIVSGYSNDATPLNYLDKKYN